MGEETSLPPSKGLSLPVLDVELADEEPDDGPELLTPPPDDEPLLPDDGE